MKGYLIMETTGNPLFDGLLGLFDKGAEVYNSIGDRKVAIAQANAEAEALAAQNRKPTQVIVGSQENGFTKFLGSQQGQIVTAIVVVVVVLISAKFLFKR